MSCRILFILVFGLTIGCNGTNTESVKKDTTIDSKTAKIQKCKNIVEEHIKCLREVYDQTNQKIAWKHCKGNAIISIQHHVQSDYQIRLKKPLRTIDSQLEKLLDEDKLSPEGELVVSGDCSGQKKNGELFVCQREQKMLQVCSDLSMALFDKSN